MNILIVEDEPLVAQGIKRTLSKCEITNLIEIANNFKEAEQKINFNATFDLILLDIFLGKNSLNGLDLCETIRKKNSRIPIIILTAAQSLRFLERAFKLGANDYITKPFNARELELRVKRWAELASQVAIKKKIIYDELSFDFQTNEVQHQEKILSLTKKNKFLLRLFLQQPEKLLTPQYLKEKIWGDYDNIDKNRNLRSNIQDLRKSLSSNCAHWIQTVRGEGYVLKKF